MYSLTQYGNKALLFSGNNCSNDISLPPPPILLKGVEVHSVNSFQEEIRLVVAYRDISFLFDYLGAFIILNCKDVSYKVPCAAKASYSKSRAL